MCAGRSGEHNALRVLATTSGITSRQGVDMIENRRRRMTFALGAAAGALTVGAFLPMAVAFADDTGWVPDPNTLNPTDDRGPRPGHRR